VAAAGYDPVRDFVPVSLVSRIPQMLLVHPAVPARSVPELIALAKARPGELSYATSGLGSTGHIAMELFSARPGFACCTCLTRAMRSRLADLLGGQVQVMFDQMSTSLAHVNAGKLRALGVTSRTRSPLLPELPTIDEQGMTGFEDVTWNALLAPTGTRARSSSGCAPKSRPPLRYPNCASVFSSVRSSCRRARRSTKPPPS